MIDQCPNDAKPGNNPRSAFDITALSWGKTNHSGEIETGFQANIIFTISAKAPRVSAPLPLTDPGSENNHTVHVVTYLDYSQPDPHAEILVSMGHKNFYSTHTSDWPVLDALFGRVAWKKFANDFAAENASD